MITVPKGGSEKGDPETYYGQFSYLEFSDQENSFSEITALRN